MVYRWEELREEEFKGAIEKSGGLCILPIGCMEVHGEHLPAGCDYYQVKAIAEAAAEREYAVVFPTGFWLGDVGGSVNYNDPINQHKAGYICLSPELRMQLLSELCDEIARNGFRKVLIVNGHGGNVGWINFFVRAHSYKKRDYATMWTWGESGKLDNVKVLYETVKADPKRFSYMTEEDMTALAKFAERGAGGGHGHINETAVVQAVVPHCVNVQRSAEVSGMSLHRSDFLEKEGVFGNFWAMDYPNAYDSYDSVGSTANIGKAIIDVNAERLARIFKIIKEDEDCVRMAQRLPKED